MAKIPFTLDALLKDKSQKIETRNGRPVHYIGLDRAGWQVFEVFRTNGTSEYRTYHDSYLYSGPGESTFDLFIITTDEELTEFEKVVKDRLWRTLEYSETFRKDENKLAHELAAELLSLARDQFIKDGYVIEKKAFHDAVEKVAPEVMKDVSDKVDMEEALRLEYEKGRTDALKDLPRWKKHEEASDKLATVRKDMTKEEFYEKVNFGRYPKYVLSQIKEGKPTKDCASIVCTASGNILLAKYENGKWYQACFTSAPDQRIYYSRINDDVIFWTDGEAEDKSRKQFE